MSNNTFDNFSTNPGIIWENNTVNSQHIDLESEHQGTLIEVKTMENSSQEEKNSMKICYFYFSCIHQILPHTKTLFYQFKSKH